MCDQAHLPPYKCTESDILYEAPTKAKVLKGKGHKEK